MKIESKIATLQNRLQNCKHFYFVGIGGIGMSALAKYYISQGFVVAGYDKTLSEITQSLAVLGAIITNFDSVDNIPQSFLDLEKTVVVYTPAISSDNSILTFLKDFGFDLYKRSEILGEITRNNFCFAVAGTHGKTTTATMLGHILKDNGIDATSFLGGISENYNSNLIEGNDKISVVEADEFDRSFLKLSPNLACITSTDADHLDIYKDAQSLEESFREFANLASQEVFVRKGIKIKGKTFAINEKADFTARNVRISDGAYIFDAATNDSSVQNIELKMPGEHNVLNALAALAMANTYGVSLPNIAKSLKSFKGIKRRFTYKINTAELVLIDDYAHHPTEINAVLNTVRNLYPSDEILAVFQPHLFSRTRDFADGFAQSLAQFDKLLLLDIYPAREKAIPGITSQWLLKKIKQIKNKEQSNFLYVQKKDVTQKINEAKSRVVVFIGAGDIGVLVEKITVELDNKLTKGK